MAVATASVFEFAADALASLGKGILAFTEEFGRARAAKALYTELAVLTDAELEAMGLKRSDITRTVFAKVYEGR